MMDIQKQLFVHSVELLARRPYHSAELRKKLEKKAEILTTNRELTDGDKGIPESPIVSEINPPQSPDSTDQIENVISRLLEYRYIDDREYLKNYIKSRQRNKPQGKLLIKQKLLQKGIPVEQFEQLFGEDSSDQEVLAKAALQKKLKTLKMATPKQKKEKAFRFLQSRGFTQDVIMQALKETDDDIKNGRYRTGTIEEHIKRVTIE